jgi:peptide/nickel transport system substrate-binding protein
MSRQEDVGLQLIETLNRRLTRRQVLQASAALGVMTVAACGSAASPSPSTGGGASTEPSTEPSGPAVNPGKLTLLVPDLGSGRFDVGLVGFAASEQQYGKLVHGALVSTSGALEKEPGLLADWQLSEDGLEWTFTFLEGVTFHDGRAISMDDIQWSFDHSFSPDAAEYLVAEEFVRIAELVESIEPDGENVLKVKTTSPVPGLLSQLFEGESTWFGIMPARAQLNSEEDAAAYDQNPVATGAFKLIEHVSGSKMVLERFEDFYHQPKNGFTDDRRPGFKTLELVQVPESSTRVAAIVNKEADIAPVNLADKEQIEAGGGRLVFGREGSYLNAYVYGVQFPEHPWHDKKVRDALNHAINKEEMRDSLLGGADAFAIKGFMAFTPSTIGYSEGLDPLPFDPDKARSLLKEAGFDGGAGFPAVTMIIQDDGSGPGLVDSGQVAAAAWREELGLTVTVEIGDATVIKEQRNAGELSQRGVVLWRTNSPRHDPTLKIIEWLNKEKPYILIDNDKLYQQALNDTALFDDEARATAYKALLQTIYNEVSGVSIGYYNPVWAVGPRVKAWEPNPLVEIASALHTIVLEG